MSFFSNGARRAPLCIAPRCEISVLYMCRPIGKRLRSDSMNKVPERLLPGQGDWDFSGHQHLQRYEFATRFITGGAILDWACGVGYGSYVLATATAGTVLGA